MEKRQPILSICLPTNGAVEWVLPTLRGVYSQGVDNSLFEVVITDNGANSSLDQCLSEFDYSNLCYEKTTDSGFLNLMTCLKKGRGLYCKMLNHRSVLVPGALQMMIDTVEKNKDSKPILYFMDGQLDAEPLVECANLDSFVRTMNYWSTWSAGVGVWQTDLNALDGLVLNETFPQSALMFDIRKESEYVISNRKYQDMQNEDGKGGYDLFWAFAVEFPNIWRELVKQGRLSKETFDYVMVKMFNFVEEQYDREIVHESKHTFIIQNVGKSIRENYGWRGYLGIVWRCKKGLWRRRINRYLHI